MEIFILIATLATTMKKLPVVGLNKVISGVRPEPMEKQDRQDLLVQLALPEQQV
jgi:hypothetical protein